MRPFCRGTAGGCPDLGVGMRIVGTIERIAMAVALFTGLGSIAVTVVPASAVAKSATAPAQASPAMWPSAVKFKGGLNSVDANSSTDAWAVGGGLALHWNGKAWSKTPSPSPGKHGTILDGVSAVSAAVAWAAGQSCASPTQTTATTCVPYILRWNGKQWTTAATSVPRSNGENMLSGMVGLSAKNAWAVGTRCASACTGASPVDNTLVLHWNGKSWS